MDRKEAISFINSGALPPTLAKRLTEQLAAAPPDRVEWLVTLLKRASITEAKFGIASERFLTAVRSLESAALDRITDEEAEIIAEFEREIANY